MHRIDGSRYVTTSGRNGNFFRDHAGGCRRVTTQREDQLLVIQAERHRFQNTTSLRNDLLKASGIRISTQTVKNCLNNTELRARIPAVSISLTDRRIRDRLNWVTTHRTWTIRDWEPALFTDESKF